MDPIRAAPDRHPGGATLLAPWRWLTKPRFCGMGMPADRPCCWSGTTP
jgi:hypothetical protein